MPPSTKNALGDRAESMHTDDMGLYFASFFAGTLTVAAPCVLPVLPVILGGSLTASSAKRPLIVTTSLAVSIVVFTLLLRATTALLGVPQAVWNTLSGGIVLAFGLVLLFPHAWERVANGLGLGGKSQRLLTGASAKEGTFGAVLIGAALGPVFASCSPTYALILAIVLPANFVNGLVHLIFYAAGIGVVMLAVALLGQRAVKKLRWAANPEGPLKKSLGIVFILVGLAVTFGWQRTLQEKIIDAGYFGIAGLEERLAEGFREP